MHDCPRCGVPLHGYEEKCPSCDTPQPVSTKNWAFLEKVPQPKMNVVPILVAVAVLGFALFMLIKTTWIGQLLTQSPQQEDPIAKLTSPEARKVIQDKLAEGLAGAGAQGKFAWVDNGAATDINCPHAVQLNVTTRLTDPAIHDSLITPVKDYMDKAQLSVLTMQDSRSHATWTYTLGVTPSPAQPAEE